MYMIYITKYIRTGYIYRHDVARHANRYYYNLNHKKLRLKYNINFRQGLSHRSITWTCSFPYNTVSSKICKNVSTKVSRLLVDNNWRYLLPCRMYRFARCHLLGSLLRPSIRMRNLRIVM